MEQKTQTCSVNECKDIKGKNCINNIHCFFVTDPEGGPEMCKSIVMTRQGSDLYKGEKRFKRLYKCYSECKWMTRIIISECN